jgi:hypothetical protein
MYTAFHRFQMAEFDVILFESMFKNMGGKQNTLCQQQ